MFISEFKIDNFRSLTGVHLKNMQRVCIFHGENNSGKSNILAAIDAILKSKHVVEEATAAGGEQQSFYRPMPFYQGRLRDFSDNFRLGSTDPIKFLLCVTLDDSELAPYQNVLKQLEGAAKAPAKQEKRTPIRPRKLKFGDGHAKVIRIEGELKYVDDSTCEAVTPNININNEFVLFQLENNEPTFIPALAKSKVTFDERAKVVNGIATLLTDSFQLVGTNRSMTTEKLKIREVPEEFLKPSVFKRSLYRLSTSRDTYDVFKEINQRFSGKPFSFGDISFSIDPKTEEVEIMIEKSSARLPLSRIGSGLQQILFLLANIFYHKKKMIGVEEIELNLSPAGQRRIFENIKSLVYEAKLISQALVTSHSPYFQDRGDVGYFEVTYDEKALTTIVKPAGKADQEKFFATGGWEQP